MEVERLRVRLKRHRQLRRKRQDLRFRLLSLLRLRCTMHGRARDQANCQRLKQCSSAD